MRFCLRGDGLGRTSSTTAWCLIVLSTVLFLGGCATTQEGTGQCYYTLKSSQRALPKFEAYAINVESKEGSRLDVYLELSYRRIHFEKEQELFTGSYSVSFVLRGADESVVRTRDIDRTVVARTYTESVSANHDAFLEEFPVPPGVYSLSIVATDNRSKLQYRRRLKLTARDFTKGGIAMSDYLLFERGRHENGVISITPLFPADLSVAQDTIGMFQELYHVDRGDTVVLQTRYAVNARKEGFGVMHPTFSPPYSPELPDCRRETDSTYYSSDSAFVVVAGGNIQIFQYLPRPREGVTALVRKVYRLHNGFVDSVTTLQKLPVYSRSFPRLRGIDEEITAISLIARPDEYDLFARDSTPALRTAELERFWEQHGGGIRRKEFLDRITEANELFSSCSVGWKTPMGIVYIVCGPPDYVECRNTTDEIWAYDLGENVPLTFTFRQNLAVDVDKYFDLVPFSVNGIIWGQLLERWRRQ